MRPAFLAASLALLPGSAAACAVCFGGDNKGLIDGFWWGIVLLLIVTMGMVAGIAWFLYKVEKARDAAEARG